MALNIKNEDTYRLAQDWQSAAVKIYNKFPGLPFEGRDADEDREDEHEHAEAHGEDQEGVLDNMHMGLFYPALSENRKGAFLKRRRGQCDMGLLG